MSLAVPRRLSCCGCGAPFASVRLRTGTQGPTVRLMACSQIEVSVRSAPCRNRDPMRLLRKQGDGHEIGCTIILAALVLTNTGFRRSLERRASALSSRAPMAVVESRVAR
jgi:hypothetical protein